MGNIQGNDKSKGFDESFPMGGRSLYVEDISPEIMFNIFLNVPVKDLITSANRVCKNWHQLLTDHHFWFTKLRAEGATMSSTSKERLLEEPNNAKVLRILQGISGHYLPFNTNLILNPSGKDGFRHWQIQHGGTHMIVECPPVGSDQIPEEAGLPTQHCFVTSYMLCVRSQELTLQRMGIEPWMMDILKPKVHISEWVSARWDCHSQNKIDISMKGSTDIEHIEMRWSSKQEDVMVSKWYKVEKVVLNYPQGLKKISYTNSGKDSQFWAGHYGAKTAGSSVELII